MLEGATPTHVLTGWFSYRQIFRFISVYISLGLYRQVWCLWKLLTPTSLVVKGSRSRVNRQSKKTLDSCLFQHLSLTPLTLACLFGMVSINWFLFPVIRAYPLRLNLRCCCIWFQVPAYIITLHDLLALTPHDHVERNTLEYAQSVLEDLSTVSLIGLHLLT